MISKYNLIPKEKLFFVKIKAKKRKLEIIKILY